MRSIRSKQNWSGHHFFGPVRYHEPESTEQLQEIVRKAEKVSVIGSRHSFNSIADTFGDLIWLGKMKQEIVIDKERKQVTVSAGITYEQLCPKLEESGFALPNLASLKHITVMGACMTATHGSGDTNQILSASISALEIIDGNGELKYYSRKQNPDIFPGMIITLGSLGVVHKITLDIVPSFKIQQNAYQELPFEDVYNHFDEITSSAYSVSLFSTWQEEYVDTLWLKHKTDTKLDTPDTFFGATRRPPEIAKQTDEVRTLTPFEVPTSWNNQLNHYYFHNPEGEGNELQSEYFVPREHIIPALKSVRSLKKELEPILGLSEIRTMGADDLWLSPAFEKSAVGIHFNWLKKGKEVEEFLPILEAVLEPFDAKPHFGKLYSMSSEKLGKVYPNIDRFKSLRKKLDPESKFVNNFIERYLTN